MKTSVGVVLLGITVMGVVTAVSCSFPPIDLVGSGGSAGAATHASSSASATASSAGSTGGSKSSSTVGSTVSTGTSSGGADGGDGGDAALPCDSGKPCDCDGDGDNSNSAECKHDGGDCNDQDPLVSSKQTGWFTMQGSNGWDYNCNGSADFEYTAVLTCPNGLICDTTTPSWQTEVPMCGQTGALGTCKGLTVALCSENVKGDKPQGCH